MFPQLLRFGYVAEFLLAILVILTMWSEVGGQEHLDLMPWYDKLVPTVLVAFMIVRATRSAVQHERAWNARTVRWVAAATVVIAGMAALTYYYHLQEDTEGDESGGNVARIFERVKPPQA